MTVKKPSFRELALASEVVTEQQINHAINLFVRSKGGDPLVAAEISDKKLAAKLVEIDALSAYQADQLLAGRKKLNLGPYVVTGWIGQGGMGQVFKAIHPMLGRECAIKVLPKIKSTPEAIKNFRREIRAQAKLDHENLVRAFDAGVDGNVHYLVVEYVPGTDLRRLVRSKGRLSVQQGANIIKQTAEALDHAHSLKLIHRDIKPGNILVTPDGSAKLSDLGLAYFLNDTSDPRVGKVVGTADYLSPEQINTPHNITHVSDIYSLGCTLYYSVTGKVPFPGGTPKSKAHRHSHETPWHPRRFNEEVSDDFVDLIGDMMEKNPRERIQSAAEVAERLAPWASDNSPLLNEDLGDRPRWIPAPVPTGDAQETDPNLDEVAEMAMNEISDESRSGWQATPQDSSTDTGSLSGSSTRPIPPTTIGSTSPRVSTVDQYKSAGHLPKDELTFTLSALFVTAITCLAIGILAGFIGGYLLGK
jgi:serine/threonine protein kinase